MKAEDIAEQLVKDWQKAGKMPPLAWDFRGFACEAMKRAAEDINESKEPARDVSIWSQAILYWVRRFQERFTRVLNISSVKHPALEIKMAEMKLPVDCDFESKTAPEAYLQQEILRLRTAVKDTVGKLQILSDNAYIDYIGLCRRDECLGWEAKVEKGIFGEAELKAHKDAAERLGKHRAMQEAANMLNGLLSESNQGHAE